MNRCMFCGASCEDGQGLCHAPWCSHTLGTTEGYNYLLRGVV